MKTLRAQGGCSERVLAQITRGEVPELGLDSIPNFERFARNSDAMLSFADRYLRLLRPRDWSYPPQALLAE